VSVETDQLRQRRWELQAWLEELAEKVAGSGHPDAPGVYVGVREPVPMRELGGARPITGTYDTVARVRVNDPDPERAARVAHAIGKALETEWVEHHSGVARVLPQEQGSSELDALFTPLVEEGSESPA
jgi:hypothetical protein